MTSPRTAQADPFPEVHNPRYYYYNESSHLWEVVVPLTDGDNPQLEWIGFYDTYDAGAMAVSNYLTASREIGDRLGVPVPIWQNMILALRARASSLENLLWNSREQLLYQVQGSNHLHNENERLKSVIELLKNPLIDYGEGAPMTPPPPPIKMTREITSMVDGDIQSPPAIPRVHSWDNALNGFDT
jgi:hypothetical protein